MGAALTALAVVVAAIVVAIMVGIVWTRRRYLLVHVTGRSMEPTLAGGQRVFARRVRLDRVRAGDVVVLAPPPGSPTGDGLLIKRVFALPGDPLPRGRVPKLRAVPGEYVPAGSLVVLGDNPPLSIDSRQLGLFPADRLLGVLVRRTSPPPALPGVQDRPDAPTRGSATGPRTLDGPPGDAGRAS